MMFKISQRCVCKVQVVILVVVGAVLLLHSKSTLVKNFQTAAAKTTNHTKSKAKNSSRMEDEDENSLVILPLVDDEEISMLEEKSHNSSSSSLFLSYRPKKYKMPSWVDEYMVWHTQERALGLANRTGVKFLVQYCFPDAKCGGTADRLRALPFLMLMAHLTQRVLLIEWRHPFPLENFLVPPLDTPRVDWRVPPGLFSTEEYKHGTLQKWDDIRKHKMKKCDKSRTSVKCMKAMANRPEISKQRVLMTKDRTESDLVMDTDVLGNGTYHQLAATIYRSMFQPVPAIVELIDNVLLETGLVPGSYVAVHIRGSYSMVIDHDLKQLNREEQNEVAENAIKCGAATAITSGSFSSENNNSTIPIFVTADNSDTVDYVLNKFSNSTRLNVTSGGTKKIHLAFSQFNTPEGFYPAFVDLWLLGMAKCLVHGIGGYGSLGGALGGGECIFEHRKKDGTLKGILSKCNKIE